MEYTDQEIEMLARFAHEASGDASTWDNLRDERKRDMRAYAIEKTSQHTLRSPIVRAAARLMREAREQGAAERAKYHADDVVLARSPLAASCVRQGVSAQAAANAFGHELHDLTQEFIRYKTNDAAPIVVAPDAVSADLIKKAREQGAAEMRERAAACLEQRAKQCAVLYRGTDGRKGSFDPSDMAEMSALEDAVNVVRVLPLSVPS